MSAWHPVMACVDLFSSSNRVIPMHLRVVPLWAGYPSESLECIRSFSFHTEFIFSKATGTQSCHLSRTDQVSSQEASRGGSGLGPGGA